MFHRENLEKIVIHCSDETIKKREERKNKRNNMENLVRQYARQYFNLRKSEIISFIKENDELYKQYINDGIERGEYNFRDADTDVTGLYILVDIKWRKDKVEYFIAVTVYPCLIEVYSIIRGNKQYG